MMQQTNDDSDVRSQIIELEHLVAKQKKILESQEQALAQTQRELALQTQVLQAMQRVCHLHRPNLDPNDVLDILSKEIISTGTFRSLMMALIDRRTQIIEVVRAYVYSNLHQDTQKTPASVLVKRPFDEEVRYPLTDNNITARTAREGSLQIIDHKEDERLDHNIEQNTTWNNKIAYFVPIRSGGNDVVGVIATGSLLEEKPALLNQIEHLNPLLNQMGVIIEDLFPERFGRTASYPPSEYLNGLSKREIQVLKSIAQEQTNKEIATTLSLSVRTVETHRKNVMKKLHIRTVVGLTKFALRHGLIQI